MQTLSVQAAFGAAAPPRRQAAAARRSSVAVRADVGFCRDKISEPKDMKGLIEGTSTIVFLGANGEEIPVECPKVRERRTRRSCHPLAKGGAGCRPRYVANRSAYRRAHPSSPVPPRGRASTS